MMHILDSVLYWSFAVGMFMFITGLAILLSYAKPTERTWPSRWSTNIAIAVLSIFAGLPAFAIVNHFLNIPSGPWNIVTLLILGIPTKNILLALAKKYCEEELEKVSQKYFS